MPTVALTFQPAAEHVRTARLVAVAVARRVGLDETRLDEIRLAVGELCGRAVRRSAVTGVTGAIVMEVDDTDPRFCVTVTDHAGALQDEDEYISLALVRGLADDTEVFDGPGGDGGAVRLVWERVAAVGPG